MSRKYKVGDRVVVDKLTQHSTDAKKKYLGKCITINEVYPSPRDEFPYSTRECAEWCFCDDELRPATPLDEALS